jgi:DNA phosphorothioation system restriction enzyme
VLQDIHLASSYRSGRNSLLIDFYIPCLSESVFYRRAAGYFTSDSLAAAGRGLYKIIQHGGQVRIVASPVLSKEDVEAIRTGYKHREQVIEEALARSFDLESLSLAAKERLGFIAWLIGEGRLDIKIALVETANGFGIYHEKIGIFSDESDNQVVFTGSANESIGGLVSNFESIDVYRSWKDEDVSRIESKIEDFESLWTNCTANLHVYDFPEALKRRLLTLRPHTTPTRDPEEPMENATASEAFPSIPSDVTIREYQKTAVEKWFEKGGKGIWRMATGTGKTITALALVTQLARLLRENKRPLFAVVVCPYKHLVSQWASEAKRFNMNPIRCFESKHLWSPVLNDLVSAANEKHLQFLAAITTNATLQTPAFQEVLARTQVSLLLIGDEVHNLGASGLSVSLPPNASYRLGLSATPERWFDEAGTEVLLRYFGEVIFELTLKEAIDLGALCKYDYFPHVVEFEGEELDAYLDLTRDITQLVGAEGGELTDETDNPRLKWLLIQRARLISSAKNKLPALEAAVDRKSAYNLFYCGDGRVQYEPAGDDIRQISAVVHMLGRRLGMSVHSYTAETYLDERDDLRIRFAAGKLQGLVAIRCLDEGVDIPETRRAFILASSTNPKQFIQRRGRVLRRAPGKELAEIHDFLVVPPARIGTDEFYATERRLFRRELERILLFARLADNGPQAVRTLLPLRERYQLLDLG